MHSKGVAALELSGRPVPIILTIINGDILGEAIQLEYKNICI